MNFEEKRGRIVFYPVVVDDVQVIPFVGGINAGFTSPAQDYQADAISLNELLIKHPSTTFFAKVDGECLSGSGINNGDIVLVDKSLQPRDGDIAVCFLDGEFTMKRLKVEKDIIWLLPDNEKFKPIKVTSDNELIIWGIVISAVKRFR